MARPRAASLFMLSDPAWRSKIFTGGWLLLVPPLGWPALLGYRQALSYHLFHATDSALPPWRGQLGTYWCNGVKSMGVIFTYLAPSYLLLAIVLLSRGWRPEEATAWLAVCFVCVPIVSTLSLPIAALLALQGGWISLLEALGLFGLFAVLVFFIPAGFLRVSATGRHLAAFNLRRVFRLIRREPRAYAAAWWHSTWISLVGHIPLPLAPWGVTWAYLAIIHLFNEVLHRAGDAPGSGWYQTLAADPRLAESRAFGLSRMTDASEARVRVLELGRFGVPLPRFRRRP